MIDHMWTILCTECQIDPSTNVVSLVGILEEVTIGGEMVEGEGQAVAPVNWQLVTQWRRRERNRPCRGRARVELIGPSGERISYEPSEYEIDLVNAPKFRSMGNIPQFPIGESGQYCFRVSLQVEGEAEWREVVSYQLEMTFQITRIPSPA